MAGYIFNLDNDISLSNYVQNGIYATKINPPNPPRNYWMPYQEGTFADYATMKPGDNVYFFIDRKIYGIGELVNIGSDCKFSNFPGSSKSYIYKDLQFIIDKKDILLWNENLDLSEKIQPWICVFKPAPYFFNKGVDMDDVLSSNPSAFKMLRAFWKVSFIKFGEEENQALKSVILKFREDELSGDKQNVYQSNYVEKHNEIEGKLKQGIDYSLNAKDILDSCNPEGSLNHEMALEAGMLYQLSRQYNETIKIFGLWDYLSHQVIASPFKPIDYMDKMDVFGYKFISGFAPTKSKYLIIELKKDDALSEDVDQLLKYVDWVKDEYCFGDYSMINAFLVAFNFNEDVVSHKEKNAVRNFVIGRRPAESKQWKDLKLVRYFYENKSREIKFEIVDK